MKTLLKVLRKDMTSPYKSFEYELGEWYTCVDFDDDSKNDCTRGFYAVDVEGLPYAYRPDYEIYWCDVDGREVEYDIYKRRYEKIRLTHQANLYEIRQMAVSREQNCGYKLSEVLFPFNPLIVFTDEEATGEIVTPSILDRLREWASVYASYDYPTRNYIRDSVLDSIDSAGWKDGANPIWNCIEWYIEKFIYQPIIYFIRRHITDPVWKIAYKSIDNIISAYVSSLFPSIKNWKGIDHEPETNPFQPGIDLWRSGFVPSYDGEKWLLHAGPKAKIIWEEVIE